MDGLLLNTEDLYTIAYQNILTPYDKEYTWDLKVKLMGLQDREAAKLLLSTLDIPLSVEEWMNAVKLQYEKIFPESQLMPGAKKLVEHLHKCNVPIALATSSTKEAYKIKTSKHHPGLFSLFSIKTFGSSDPEVKYGKPHPDIFLVTANRFPDKPKPEQCLVFEDAANGVKAGRAAGMQVVMVPDAKLDRSLTTEATLVLESLEDFKPELFGLPPYDT
ncbi:unnamed protein product [Arctia plantaginis]|uniref:pseudouridine 5'-phosphatase n=1 Tax=Arctia plantaginis TaxID=874455 RepID=A0A8S0ZLK7_ARCPL|nr:unnamed protein product [Arctia plantaginis]CAB3238420.1 unnamed protein product [Arctia plantaginis]